jgi:hypothetical protein
MLKRGQDDGLCPAGLPLMKDTEGSKGATYLQGFLVRVGLMEFTKDVDYSRLLPITPYHASTR